MSWVPRIGEDFAGYRLESMLGQGGMSIVYRAEQSAGTKVALKVLAPRVRRTTRASASGSTESRVWRPASTTPTSSRSTRPARSDGLSLHRDALRQRSRIRRLTRSRATRADLRGAAPQPGRQARSDGARERAHPPGHQARKHPHRPPGGHDGSDHVYLTDFGVAKQVGSPSRADDAPGCSWAPPSMRPRSRSRALLSTVGPTCMRSAASSTNA